MHYDDKLFIIDIHFESKIVKRKLFDTSLLKDTLLRICSKLSLYSNVVYSKEEESYCLFEWTL